MPQQVPTADGGRPLTPPGSSPRYALVTAGAICGQLSAGIVLSGLSMFTDPIRDDLWPAHDVPRAAVQSYYTVVLMVAMTTMPLAGRLIGNWGGRRLLVVGGTISTLGLIGISTATGLAGLYLFAAITGAGFGISVNFVPVVLVNTWFEKRKSLVMGMVVAGTALGGILASVVFSNLTPPVDEGGLGWRATMRIAAAIFAFFALVPAIVLVVNHPADVGLPRYGARPAGGSADSPGQVSGHLHGLKSGEALRSGWFWLLYLALCILGVHHAMGQITQPFFMNQQTDPGSGMTPALVGVFMTISMVGLIAAKPALGALIDRVGMIRAVVIVLTLHAIAAIALASVRFPAPVWFYPVLVLAGAGFAVGTVTPPLVCSMAFGQRQFAAIYGVLGTAYMFGLAFGSVLWSQAGTVGADPGQPWQLYRWAMRWCWVLSVGIVLGYWASVKGGRRLQRRLRPEVVPAPIRL